MPNLLNQHGPVNSAQVSLDLGSNMINQGLIEQGNTRAQRKLIQPPLTTRKPRNNSKEILDELQKNNLVPEQKANNRFKNNRISVEVGHKI